MKYIDVFRTSDRHEHSIIKNLFDDERLDYRSHGEVTDNATNIGALGNDGLRIEVAESDRDKATEIIKRSGFLGQSHNIAQPKRRKPQIGKWVIIVLAMLVVLVAIILFVWFMNA
ncbi:putative signal transducing protein [Salegentibacter salegens]|uniref:Putative signal transducing protein n=1 Tax=Salegentibacter salegens TaxID=143223 RepID=A0A1M7MTP2_9FLAO|nr:DUF2007 domain-containing protein [Salegentibacter salegens]PRX52516.1 putative signal transducing protein [Salegentibacter salegens]SHM94488.1 Putative signal transducing protein [Salegentibacter salegens]